MLKFFLASLLEKLATLTCSDLKFIRNVCALPSSTGSGDSDRDFDRDCTEGVDQFGEQINIKSSKPQP